MNKVYYSRPLDPESHPDDDLEGLPEGLKEVISQARLDDMCRYWDNRPEEVAACMNALDGPVITIRDYPDGTSTIRETP